jgi:hypothetical protein
MAKLYDIAIAPHGKIYATNNDPANGDILELQLDADGAISSSIHSFMASVPQYHPKGITVDPSGEHIYVAAFEKELSASDVSDKMGRTKTKATRPKASVLHITKIEGADGKYQVDHVGKDIGSPEGLAVDSTNTNIYVANTWPDSIVRITLTPPYAQKTIATFHQPHGVAIDHADKYLYVANTNGAIVRVTLPDGPACTIQTGGATFDYPYFLTITRDGSRLYTTNAGVMSETRFITLTQLTFTPAPTALPTLFHTPSPTPPPTPLITSGPPTAQPTLPTLSPTAIPTKAVPDLTFPPTTTPAPTFKPRWVDVDALHPLPEKDEDTGNARIPQALELQGGKGVVAKPAPAPTLTSGVVVPAASAGQAQAATAVASTGGDNLAAAAAAVGLPLSVYQATAARAKEKAAAAAVGLPLSVLQAQAARARAQAFAESGGVLGVRHAPPKPVPQTHKLSSMDEVLAAGTAVGKRNTEASTSVATGASDNALCRSGHGGSEGCSLELGGASSPSAVAAQGGGSNGWVELQNFGDLKTVVREYMTVETWFMVLGDEINDSEGGKQAKEAAGKGASGGGKARFAFISATQVDQRGFARGWSLGIGSKPLTMSGGSAYQERRGARSLLATTVAFDLCTEQRPMHSLNVDPAGAEAGIGGQGGNEIGVQKGRWYHAAAVYDGKMMSLYVDGQKQGQWPMRGAILYNKRAPFLIGATIGPYGKVSSFKGKIDEMRLWNIARSAADVRGSYEGTVPASALGLLAYWRFDHPNGTFACSETGHFWGW